MHVATCRPRRTIMAMYGLTRGKSERLKIASTTAEMTKMLSTTQTQSPPSSLPTPIRTPKAAAAATIA